MGSFTGEQYVLDNGWERGQRRLRGLEATYDSVTQRRLTALGVDSGWTCLEAGAGGGSIARWLGRRVGPGGTVVAADLDVSLLMEMPENVRVRQLDVRVDPLPERAFDLIHARLLLNHLSQREQVLDRFVAALRPGGWLLLEEGDTFASGAIDEEEDHARAMRAWCDTLARVADVDLGRKLPRLFHERGLSEIGVECELPFAQGGSIGADFLQLTFDQLNEGAGGNILDAETIRRWKKLLTQPGQWFASLALVAVSGRRVH